MVSSSGSCAGWLWEYNLRSEIKKVPVEAVGKYWHAINSKQDHAAVYRNLKELHVNQPLIMTYLMVAEKNIMNEDERQALYYLGGFAARVLFDELAPIPEVTENEWDQARELNLKMIGFIGSELTPEDFIRSLQDVIITHRQSDLLAFVTELLMRDPLFARVIREDNVWRIFTHLKVVIDCLDKAGQNFDAPRQDDQARLIYPRAYDLNKINPESNDE